MEISRFRNALLPSLVAAALLAAGCGPALVQLSYQSEGAPIQARPASVGVYYLEDARPGWPATSPARTVAMVTAELPITFNVHGEGNKAVSVFVAEALRSELSAAGLKIVAAPEFDRPLGPAGLSGVRATNAERVLVGRINYFGWLQPGFAGLLFQSGMPTGKVFVDVDLWVVDPRTGEIRWAGSVRQKQDSGDSSGKSATVVAPLLSRGLRAALAQVTRQSDFWAAMAGDVPVGLAPGSGPDRSAVLGQLPVLMAAGDRGRGTVSVDPPAAPRDQ